MIGSFRVTVSRWCAVLVSALVAPLIAASCAHTPLPLSRDLAFQSPPAAGVSTVALWHFDEATGLAFADSGPAGRDGVLGIDTRATFGRFRTARLFTGSINSFGIVPADRAPDLGPQWTIELWLKPTQFAQIECNTIAGRWTNQPNEQSWMLGLVGFNRSLVPGAPARPNLFDGLIPSRIPGLLLFAFQPQDAGEARAFTSTVPVERDRWTHVAVTYDGHELRMYIDGRLDAQFASADPIRTAPAPLIIGNLVDARLLTESQGPLRVPPDSAPYPFYAFEGAIDELRITRVALDTGPARR